jgi:beta-glucuronidase
MMALSHDDRTVGMRHVIDLCGVWRFQPDPFEEGEHLGYPAIGPDVSGWREVSLPGVVDRMAPVMASYEGLAWYQRLVHIPADWRARCIAIRFDGANHRTRVWVNGTLVGQNDDPFLPFEFRIDQAVRVGEQNQVVVAVDSVRRDADVPGKQRGWRPYGGILREISLIATDPCHLTQVRADARPAAGGGRLDLRVRVHNQRPTDASVSIGIQVSDSEGRRMAGQRTPPHQIGRDAVEEIVADLIVPAVMPWSPEQPALYTADISLHVGVDPIDTQALRIGFRSIEARDGKLLLNGREVFLLGFNRHEDSPSADQASDIETSRHDLLDIKRMGCNYLRLCHYPHHPRELDLCDEIGLMAMCEIPLYWWGGNYGSEKGIDEEGKLPVARRQVTRMIERDASHPSVIIWSVSNETFEESPEVVAGNDELVRLAQELDRTRPATHVSDKWARHPDRFAADDVICINAYPSWGARGMQKQHDYDMDQSRLWWIQNITRLRQVNPGKPVLVTEFGNPAFEGVRGNFIGEDSQAHVIETEFAAMTPDLVCGATIWCYADHPWPEDDFVRHITTSPFGVVTRQRRRKQAAAVVERLFRQRRQLPDPPPRPMPGPDEDVPVRMVRSHMRDIPQASFPIGFSIRTMRPDEGPLWTDVQRDAERMFSISDDLFDREFGHDPQGIARRCFLIVNEHGAAVGTLSAWYSRDEEGKESGQIHWVAVRPAYQGKGLARAGLAYAMNKLAEWHGSAWLGTSTSRLPALKLYLDFGFGPLIRSDADLFAWRRVREKLRHAGLDGV